jgi:hypothetical protein
MRKALPRGRFLRALALAALAASCAPAGAVERDALEAAVVYNVLQFVQWPFEGDSAAPATLTLCLDAASPLYAPARQLDGRPVRGLRLGVQAMDAAAGRCQVIVVDTPAGVKTAAALHGGTGRDAVLVIEAAGFEQCESPMIQLIESDGRLAFDISQKRARASGLVVSSRLLRLAHKVSE